MQSHGFGPADIAENDRRLKPYDNRLKRPRFVPFVARMALKFIRPKKKAA